MKERQFFYIVAACCLVQASVLNIFRVFAVKPDLIFICVAASAFFLPARRALCVSILCGLFKDIFGAGKFGMNVFFLCAWCVLIIKLSKEISVEDNYIFAALIFILVLINDIAMWLALFYLGNAIPAGIFLRITILEALYTALVSPFIFKSVKPVIQ